MGLRNAILMTTMISKKARFEKIHPTPTLFLQPIPTMILRSALTQIPTDHADGKDTESPLQDSTAETVTGIKIDMNTDTDLSRRRIHTDLCRPRSHKHKHNKTTIKTLKIVTRGTNQRTFRRDFPHSTNLTTLITITTPTVATKSTITTHHPTPQSHRETTESPNN